MYWYWSVKSIEIQKAESLILLHLQPYSESKVELEVKLGRNFASFLQVYSLFYLNLT